MTKVAKSVPGVKSPLPDTDEAIYLKLSDVTKDYLLTPQRSDTFVKKLKDAVREEEIQAAVLKGERFTLPKKFRKRDSDEDYTRETRDYVIKNDDAFQEWFNTVNAELASTREGKVRVTVDSIAAGVVDFDKLVADTRKGLQKSYEKGQTLGRTFGKNSAKVEEEEEEEVVAPAKKGGKKVAPPAPAPKAKPPTAKKKPEPEPEEEDEDEIDEDDEEEDDDLLEDDDDE